MECKVCDRQFDLFSYAVPHKGMMETYRGWVRKDLLREVKTLRRQAEAKAALLRRQLRRHLSDKWLAHFGGRSKKDVWGELTESGATYPALATFYSHVRHSGMENVLLQYLDGRNLARIQKVLKLPRGPLTELAEEIRKLEKSVDAREGQARRQAFS